MALLAWCVDRFWVGPYFERWHARRWWWAAWDAVDTRMTLLLVVGLFAHHQRVGDRPGLYPDAVRRVLASLVADTDEAFDPDLTLGDLSVARQWAEANQAELPARV